MYYSLYIDLFCQNQWTVEKVERFVIQNKFGLYMIYVSFPAYSVTPRNLYSTTISFFGWTFSFK